MASFRKKSAKFTHNYRLSRRQDSKKVVSRSASIYVITLYNFSQLEIPSEYYRGINNLEIIDKVLYLPSKSKPILKVIFEKIHIVYHGSTRLKDEELLYDFYLPSKLDIDTLNIAPNDTDTLVLSTKN